MPDPISWQLALPYFALGMAGGYLLGSIPFGLLLTKLAGLGDIRAVGSGNIGATNVLRTGRKDLAAMTLLLDGAKGTLATLIGAHWGPDFAVLAAVGAFLGHLFPVWLKFKGGKGVAIFIGILLALNWQVGLLACVIWVGTAFLFRMSSVAGMSMAVSSIPIMFWLDTRQNTQVCAFLVILLLIRHHENIRRLIKGEEPKIGQKKKVQS